MTVTEDRPTIAEELASPLPDIAPGLVDHHLVLADVMTSGPNVDVLDVLRELTRRPAWMADAACREHPELNFHPERGDDTRQQVAVCGGCNVREECLSYALANDDDKGIWGGLSGRQRRRIRKDQRDAA